VGFTVIDDVSEHLTEKIGSLCRKHLYFKQLDYHGADYGHRLNNNLFRGSLKNFLRVPAEVRIFVFDRVQLHTERAHTDHVVGKTRSYRFYANLVGLPEFFDDGRHHLVAALVYCQVRVPQFA